MKQYPENWACCAYGAELCSDCGTIHCVHQCCEPRWQRHLKRCRELTEERLKQKGVEKQMKILVEEGDLTQIQALIELGNYNQALDILDEILRKARKGQGENK